MFIEGESYSNFKQTYIELKSLSIKLNAISNGQKNDNLKAFILFNENKSKAEIFLPKNHQGIVLDRINSGNWGNQDYLLISWKGYVLQKKGIPIFGG